jgi:hypothetical protein
MRFPVAIESDRTLVRWLTLTGMALAIWVITLLHGRINNDATLYLEMARRFAVGDTQGALALYNWPLFPWLMAKIHGLTGMSVQYAAHLLNVAFFGIATWSFLSLIRECGGSRTTLLSGAVLLFSAPYIVGDVLPMIMRDQGFWAFHLLSLLFFLRFYRSLGWGHALAWQSAAMAGVLFRVEGVTFLILLPLMMVFRRDLVWRQRTSVLLKAYLLPLLGIAALALVLLLMPGLDVHKSLGRLIEIQTSLQTSYHQLASGLAMKASIYGKQVLGSFMAEYAMTGLILTLLAVVVANIIGASGWLGIGLGCLVRTERQDVLLQDARQMLYWAVALNLLNLAVIILTVFLLSGRYAVPLAYIILIFAAFHLAGLYRTWHRDRASLSWRSKTAYAALAIVLGLFLLDNVIQRGTYPDHEQIAAVWIKQNVAPDARIFFDEARMRYYAGAAWEGRDTSWGSLMAEIRVNPMPYDYLVLHLKHKRPEARLALLAQMRQYQVIRQFVAKNGDKVLVLRGASSAQPDANVTSGSDLKEMK